MYVPGVFVRSLRVRARTAGSAKPASRKSARSPASGSAPAIQRNQSSIVRTSAGGRGSVEVISATAARPPGLSTR